MNTRTWRLRSPKELALIVTMGALGNALALTASYLGNIHPQVALDLSHIATFLIALNLGPLAGFTTGCIAGFFTYYRFGVMGSYGPFLGLLIIPLKGITGIFSGLLVKKVKPFFAVTLGFIPESVSTFLYMRYFVALFLTAKTMQFIIPIIMTVLIKAWVEIFVLGILMEIIQRNQAIQHFIKSARAQ